MPTFVHLHEYNHDTGALINPLELKTLDSVITDVRSRTFVTERASASTPPVVLLTDLMITKATEVEITAIDSFCSLQNTLFVFTYVGDRPNSLSDISGDVFVVAQRAHIDAIQRGRPFRIPSTYSTTTYASHEIVSEVTSYTHSIGTNIAFLLVSPGWDALQIENMDALVASNRSRLYTDFLKNRGGVVNNKLQSLYRQETARRHFIGIEDIQLSDAQCDADFNDIVVEVATTVDDAFQNFTGAVSNVSRIKVYQGPLSSVSTPVNVAGVYSAVGKAFLNSKGAFVSGGTRQRFTLGSHSIVFSETAGAWILKPSSGSNVLIGGNGTTPSDTFVCASDLCGLYLPNVSIYTGTVINAVTSAPVSFSTVVFGPYSTVCDANGLFELTIDPNLVNVNTTQAVFAHYGFVDLYSFIPSSGLFFPLSPLSATPVVRFVVTWGELPSDLDSYMRSPTYTIFYGNTSGSGANGETATLDVDDTNSFGPETISINNYGTGTYQYWIHNYSNEVTLSAISNAYVKVYIDNALVMDRSISSAQNWNNAAANYWYVCDVINGAVVPRHQFLTSAPSP
jgi:hypothetical protein